eukprot:UN1951
MMGTHGLSQATMTLVMVPHYPWTIVCGMSMLLFVSKLGERRTYTTFKILAFLVVLLCTPLMALSPCVGLGMWYTLGFLNTVDGGLERPLNHTCVQEAYRAKSKALWSLLYKAWMPVNLCLYSRLYDPKAGSLFYQSLPFFVSIGFNVCGVVVQWGWVWPVHAPELVKMQEERLSAMDKAPTADVAGQGILVTMAKCWTRRFWERTAKVILAAVMATMLTRRMLAGLMAGAAAFLHTMTRRESNGRS